MKSKLSQWLKENDANKSALLERAIIKQIKKELGLSELKFYARTLKNMDRLLEIVIVMNAPIPNNLEHDHYFHYYELPLPRFLELLKGEIKEKIYFLDLRKEYNNFSDFRKDLLIYLLSDLK